MNPDTYEELRSVLDRFPSGCPKTEEGIELDILRSFFSEEEARIACHLPLQAEPDALPKGADAIADEMGRNTDEVDAILELMMKKGLIYAIGHKLTRTYSLLPLAPGIWEINSDIYEKRPELARLNAKYIFGAQGQAMMEGKIPFSKIIPVNESIAVQTVIHPYEDVKRLIEEARSCAIVPCACRTTKKLSGEGCNRSTDTCLWFNEFADHIVEIGKGRSVSKEEAVAIIAQAEEAGCMHCTVNTQEVFAICSCCVCCCICLQLLVNTRNTMAVAKSDFILTADQDLCVGCEACVDQCVFKALEVENGIVSVDGQRCLGCGKCVRACATEALSLQRKAEVAPTPASYVEMLSQMGWRK